MSTITEIQQAIVCLSEQERVELRQWLNTFDEDDWDRQITRDAASGKLDFLAQEVQSAKNSGQLQPLPTGGIS